MHMAGNHTLFVVRQWRNDVQAPTLMTSIIVIKSSDEHSTVIITMLQSAQFSAYLSAMIKYQ